MTKITTDTAADLAMRLRGYDDLYGPTVGPADEDKALLCLDLVNAADTIDTLRSHLDEAETKFDEAVELLRFIAGSPDRNRQENVTHDNAYVAFIRLNDIYCGLCERARAFVANRTDQPAQKQSMADDSWPEAIRRLTGQ